MTGPALFLCHGLTSNHQTWDRVVEPLVEAGLRLYAFDMRGHGRSDWPDSGYGPQDHGRDIEACARALQTEKIHVVGHSTGGRNALMFAALFPDKARTLTIIDQTLTADPESWKKYRDRYRGYPAPFVDEKSLDDFLRLKFTDDTRRRDYYKSQFSPKSDGRWDFNFSVEAAWETQRLGRAESSHPWLARVTAPALFVKGADSHYVAIEEAHGIARSLPRGRLAVVDKAEHAVHRDNPEGFLEVFLPFLRENF
ncbi:MAG: alpha/beta fold hydrolase [bacterium]